MPCLYAEQRETIKAKFRATAEFIRNYKRRHPCVDCGESDWRCLDFDHTGEKRFQLSDFAGKSIAVLETEMAKCQIRCSNCHRKRHLPIS